MKSFKNKGQICSVESCEKPAFALTYCAMHHRRWLTHGDVEKKTSKLVDHTGKVFGSLTVVRYVGGRRSLWECECACGNITTVAAQKLLDGHTKTCGCRHGKPPAMRGAQQVRWIYERNSKDRGHSFELDDSQLTSLITALCVYCNAEPSNTTKDGYKYNGIDRINNSIGYTMENSVTSCWTCNQMKGSLSVDEFLLAVKRIANHVL